MQPLRALPRTCHGQPPRSHPARAGLGPLGSEGRRAPVTLFHPGPPLPSILALLGSLALAAPTITIRAAVSDDLRVVRGTLETRELTDVVWRNALVDLPRAKGDLDGSRMWPGHADQGELTWTQSGDTLTFEARLPHRFGDIGWSQRGLFANGAWYPVALVDGALPIVDWDVELEVPPGIVGVVGNVAAPGVVRWTGHGERASLAALRHAHLTLHHDEGHSVVVLTRRKPRRALTRTLADQLTVMNVEGVTWEGVVVETPLRLDLVRPGLGVAYLSDLAYEVFPGFARLHAADVAEGLAASFAPSSDPLTRAVTGAAMGFRQRVAIGAEKQRQKLTRIRWLSIVDNALRAADMRFQDTILQEPAPMRPVHDDLVDRFNPHIPGAVALGQVRARVGDEAAIEMGLALARGSTLQEATCDAGYPGDPHAAWAGLYLPRDYAVLAHRGVVTVTREAAADTPGEVVELDVDGERRLWETPAGPAELVLEGEGIKKVVVDPDLQVGQTTRNNDRIPQPVYAVAGVLLGRVDFLQEFVEAELNFTLRRAADTHNTFMLGAFSNQRDRIGAITGWTALVGRPTLRTVREHGLSLQLEFTVLNPLFDAGEENRTSVGGRFIWTWDNRESALFPRKGASVRLALLGGGAPEGGNAYAQATAKATATFAPHPRVVLAGRAMVGFAAADASTRRLMFGGPDGVRAIPDQLVQPNAQGILSLEIRPVLFDHAHVPLGVGTMSTMYAFAGLDVGAASLAGLPALALGANVGVGTVFSVLGITPGSVHVTVGIPVVTYGLDPERTGFPVTFTASWGVPF